MRYQHYALPQTFEEAWTLNQKKSNRVLGGGMWLRYEKRAFDTAIDLSALPIKGIEETENAFRVGAMTPLHQLETHAGLNALTGGAVRDALWHIVGVQFRNCATVGGSVYNKSGFSDVFTLLTALDAEAVFYRRGAVSLARYADLKKDRDLLLYVDIPKASVAVSYQSVRASQTGFPILACAVARKKDAVQAVIGARPARARAVCLQSGETEEDFVSRVQGSLIFGDNVLGSAAYRRHLCGVLVRRGLEQTKGGEKE